MGKGKQAIFLQFFLKINSWLVFLGHTGAEVHIQTPCSNYSTCDVKPVHQIFLSVVGDKLETAMQRDFY